MSPTVYVVTGATRGIGFNLVKNLSSRPDTIIFAGSRSFPLKDNDQLAQLAANLPDVVIPIKITSADEADNAAAAELIKLKVGKVDVIIANAGVTSGIIPVLQATPANFHDDFNVNVVGPFVLFKSFHPLLLAAGNSSKFVVVSSRAGETTNMITFPVTAYGTSKAGVNHLTKRIDQETPEVAAFPIHPGMVDTDMGRAAAVQFGRKIEDLGAISETTSVEGILAVVDKATKETHGGKFWSYDGTELTY